MARHDSDEHYVLDLCDDVLGSVGLRQHRFDFLLSDPGPKTGRQVKLPVSAYYPELGLVIEYYGARRRPYDQRRHDVLLRNDIRLIEINWSDLPHDTRGRLLRPDADRRSIHQFLAGYVDPPALRSHTRHLLHTLRGARCQSARLL
ncbi:MAG: hypothetical protein P8Y69_05445 [Gammaproteobacteria bacterium]